MVEPKDSWNVYNIKKINGSFGKYKILKYLIPNKKNVIIFYCLFLDTFLKARDKLNEVTRYNLSEVGTDFEENNKSTRKIRATAKNSSSNEEIEITSGLSQLPKFPSPPCSPNMFQSPGKLLDCLLYIV